MDSNEIYWYLIEELHISRDDAACLAPQVAEKLADYSFEYDSRRIDEVVEQIS